jgi:ankyrin repeat protein
VHILSQEGYTTDTVASMSAVSSCLTPERIENYHHETIALVQSRNINQLRENYKTGQCTNPCNRFGESLLHMACRRGFTEVASFFVQEAQQDVRVRDDYGRTPLHDVCWSVEPNFDLLKLLIVQDPSLLFVSDKRNHCPLDYVRKEHWGVIKAFLTENKDVLFSGLAKK